MYAIHTLFILKENILFLEEWIDYHMQIGFKKFFLYDNSKVQVSGGCHKNKKHFVCGKVNKYNVNYDKIIKLNDKQLEQKKNEIKKKYKKNVFFYEWSPKDKKGRICFNHEQANNHCLNMMKKLKNISWCANIDIDEFIVLEKKKKIKYLIRKLPKNINNIKLSQIRFDSRFNNLNKRVIQINKSEIDKLPLNHSNKNIYKVSETKKMKVHQWIGNGKELKTKLKNIWFNHYKLNRSHYTKVKNINRKLVKKIKKNSKNYIKINN